MILPPSLSLSIHPSLNLAMLLLCNEWRSDMIDPKSISRTCLLSASHTWTNTFFVGWLSSQWMISINTIQSLHYIYMAGSKIESKSFAPQSCCYLPLVRVDTHLLWRKGPLTCNWVTITEPLPRLSKHESAVPAQSQESNGRNGGVQSIVVACFSISPVWEVIQIYTNCEVFVYIRVVGFAFAVYSLLVYIVLCFPDRVNLSFQIRPAWSDMFKMESADTQPNLTLVPILRASWHPNPAKLTATIEGQM